MLKRLALPAVLLVALGACTEDDKRQANPTEPTVAPSASRAAAEEAAPKSSICLAVEADRESRRVIANKKLDLEAEEARADVSEMDALIADACQ